MWNLQNYFQIILSKFHYTNNMVNNDWINTAHVILLFVYTQA